MQLRLTGKSSFGRTAPFFCASIADDRSESYEALIVRNVRHAFHPITFFDFDREA
jgi:hypothetical protein